MNFGRFIMENLCMLQMIKNENKTTLALKDLPWVWQPSVFVWHSREHRNKISHVELGQLVLQFQKVACNYLFGNF